MTLTTEGFREKWSKWSKNGMTRIRRSLQVLEPWGSEINLKVGEKDKVTWWYSPAWSLGGKDHLPEFTVGKAAISPPYAWVSAEIKPPKRHQCYFILLRFGYLVFQGTGSGKPSRTSALIPNLPCRVTCLANEPRLGVRLRPRGGQHSVPKLTHD